jgi:hypothetical protein
MLVAATGSWNSTLLGAAFCSLAAGLIARFVLVPMRRRMRDRFAEATALVTASP